MKFLQKKGSMRLGSRSALTHPWITGNPSDPIPLTADEIFLTMETRSKLYVSFRVLKLLVGLRNSEGFERNETEEKTSGHLRKVRNFILFIFLENHFFDWKYQL